MLHETVQFQKQIHIMYLLPFLSCFLFQWEVKKENIHKLAGSVEIKTSFAYSLGTQVSQSLGMHAS